MENNEKPPSSSSSLRQPVTIRVRPSSNDWRSLRGREMASIQHLPRPDLRSRFRNDLVVLETI